MSGRTTRLRSLVALGLVNGGRVLAYRLGLRLGIHPVQRAKASVPPGRFFHAPASGPAPAEAPAHWRDDMLLFGAHRVEIGDAPPAWSLDPLSGEGGTDCRPWWRIDDFAGGDIKRIWEFSRFDWAMAFAQQARCGDGAALDRLNAWIEDWIARNPPYLGPNWKCAQEASIRLLHLSIAAIALGTERSVSAPLQALLDAHIRRIVPTLSYAHAQDNNHATSEAAALFVAGAWLDMVGMPGGRQWQRKGRRLLERHVLRLFGTDGSFSQYSLNYHRVALDTVAIAEIWRRRSGLPPFSKRFLARAAAATDWLYAMVDPASGDTPNLGANDGANLLALTGADYRDYRPAVQLASVLFRGTRAYPPGTWDHALAWLGVENVAAMADPPASAVFDDGGYAVLRRGGAMALLRYPRFRFRPSQADALHVDLWVEGENLLRDGGTFSYNTDQRWIDYFGGIEAHNSVQFDRLPQMPRVSRFLLGDWLTTDDRGPLLGERGEPGYWASYCHRRGWRHRRDVLLGDRALLVTDTVSGFATEATVRWRLSPGAWTWNGKYATNGGHRLTIDADMPIVRAAIVTGHESRYYLDMSELPVLEITVATSGRITSEYCWTS